MGGTGHRLAQPSQGLGVALAFEVMAERRVNLRGKVRHFRIQPRCGGLECDEMSRRIAVAEGVIGDQIQPSFEGSVEFFVQFKKVGHGANQTPTP